MFYCFKRIPPPRRHLWGPVALYSQWDPFGFGIESFSAWGGDSMPYCRGGGDSDSKANF